MSALVIVGAQWGDEGKGKIVDLFAAHSDVVVRYQGGNNAGHTLVVGTERTVVHLIPAGVLHGQTICVIASGVVIDPKVLCEEIAELKARDDDGTILVHGGPDFAKSMTRLGLVDEYQLTTVPIAIGAGHSPFADLEAHLKLDVVKEQRFQNGALAQILVPKR